MACGTPVRVSPLLGRDWSEVEISERWKQPAHSFGGIFSIISGRLACGFVSSFRVPLPDLPASYVRSGARSFFSLVGAFSRTVVNRSSIAFHLPESLVARLVCALAKFFCSDRSL